jgi:hypothetical protein
MPLTLTLTLLLILCLSVLCSSLRCLSLLLLSCATQLASRLVDRLAYWQADCICGRGRYNSPPPCHTPGCHGDHVASLCFLTDLHDLIPPSVSEGTFRLSVSPDSTWITCPVYPQTRVLSSTPDPGILHNIRFDSASMSLFESLRIDHNPIRSGIVSLLCWLS